MKYFILYHYMKFYYIQSYYNSLDQIMHIYIFIYLCQELRGWFTARQSLLQGTFWVELRNLEAEGMPQTTEPVDTWIILVPANDRLFLETMQEECLSGSTPPNTPP